MLLDDDLRIVSGDPVIRGLRTVLDAEVLATSLKEQGVIGRGADLEITYLRYKPGVSVIAGYVADGTRGYTVAASDAARSRLRRAERDHRRSPERVHLLESSAAYVFPFDARIGALRRLDDDHRWRKLLRRSADRDPRFDFESSTLLGYRPERRCVFRLDGSSTAVLRLYDAARYTAAVESHSVATSRDRLRIAHTIGTNPRYRSLMTEWLAGEPLRSGDWEELSQVGAALAELHAQEPPDEFRLSGRHAKRVKAVGEYLALLMPELASDIASLVRLLGRSMGDTRAAVLTHGDLHPQQILLESGRVSLIDLDRLSIADGRFDLGNLLAHIESDRLASGDVVDLRSAAEALAEGYGRRAEASAPGWSELRPFIAAGLLLLGTEPFRLRLPHWRDATIRIIERARELMESEAHRGAMITSTAVPTNEDGIDPGMPWLVEALDPGNVERALSTQLQPNSGMRHGWRVGAARILRHKRGRRALIEYEAIRDGSPVVLLGKCRAKGVDRAAHSTLVALRTAGFTEEGNFGAFVPPPVGILTRFRMYLQERVDAAPSLEHLLAPDGVNAARRIAEGIFRLHSSGVTARRRHTVDDELATLRSGLATLAADRSDLSPRLERLLESSMSLARTIPHPSREGSIHRDFYHDQVLLTREQVVIVDLDLFAIGDPAVDVGNFLAHLIEWSLRKEGDPQRLAGVRSAFEERYVELTAEEVRPRIRAYETLTLVRHVYLSTRFADRTFTTEPLLALCESALGTRTRAAENRKG